LSLVALPAEEGDEWHAHFGELSVAGRAAVARTPRGHEFWVATEMWPVAQALWEGAVATPPVEAPADVRHDWPRDEAVKIAVRGRLEASGPVLGAAIAKDLALPMG